MEHLNFVSNPLRIIEDESEYDNSKNTSVDSQFCLQIVEEENISQSNMNDDVLDNNLHCLSLQINDDGGVTNNSITLNEASNSATVENESIFDNDDNDDNETSIETPQVETAKSIDDSDSVVHLLGQINDIVGPILIMIRKRFMC